MALCKLTTPWPLHFQHLKTLPKYIDPLQVEVVSSVTIPSSSAAMADIILKVDPGGYWL